MMEVNAVPEAVTALVDETRAMLSQYEKGVKITADTEYMVFADDLKVIKAKYNAIDDKRREFTRPIDKLKKDWMDFFAIPLDRLAKAESIIKAAMINYQRDKERARQETERALKEKAEKAREKGKEDKAEDLINQAAVVSQQEVAPKVAGVIIRKAWKVRIVDATKVPRAYMVVNEEALRKVAQATKGTLTIPGVEFYEEDILAAGGVR